MEQELFIANIFHIVLGGLISLITGGLATQFGYRSADRHTGESRMPHCLYCQSRLQWYEFFPLFGWLLRKNPFTLPCPCGKKLQQWPQPLAEFTAFGLGAASVAFAGWGWEALPVCIGLGLLPAIALIDFSFGIIPDGLNLLLGLCGIGWAFSHGDIFIGMIMSALLLCLGLGLALGYSKLRGKEMLGIGDVKFFAAAGLWLPLEYGPPFLFGAGLFGILFSLAWRRISGEKEFPFAPALCFSLALCILVQLFLAFWSE